MVPSFSVTETSFFTRPDTSSLPTKRISSTSVSTFIVFGFFFRYGGLDLDGVWSCSGTMKALAIAIALASASAPPLSLPTLLPTAVIFNNAS